MRSKADLLREVWRMPATLRTRTVDSHASRLRRKLVAAGADTTITGTGAPGFYGKTAADLATERGDKRLAAYIASWSPA